MIFDKIKILAASEIDEIQRKWKGSELPITNPRGYSDLNKHDPSIKHPDKQELRNLHLKELLRIIYKGVLKNQSYYVSGINKSTLAFEKYIYKNVILQYPLNSLDSPYHPNNFQDEDLEFNKWIQNIFTAKPRVQWSPIKLEYPKIENITSDKDITLLCELRFQRLFQLAKICNFIDCIQVEDYQKNEIRITNQGKFEGNIKGLIYGDKHALSAYLGHWIVRHFPFKDIKGFHSQSWKKGPSMIYEHFTPMSFFRDLIWIKNTEGNAEYVFDYKCSNSKPFGIEEWLSILWYRYRTITIDKKEDKILNDNKEKSRRSAGNKAYKDAEIHLPQEQEIIWEGVHSIEQLKSILDFA